MARKRKGSDPGLALIEAGAKIGGVLLLLWFLKNPTEARSLAPILVTGVIAIAALFILIRASLSAKSSRGTGGSTHSSVDDTERRAPTSVAVPKAEAALQTRTAQSCAEKLEHIDWYQFEKVVAMLYSSRGCKVERRGGANPDGGIDLVVNSGTRQFAVQCKFWKAYEVGVRQVREFLGALQDAGISEGIILSIKGFTAPARELASRHKIELIGKSDLLAMLNDARSTAHIREINAIMASDDKRCPKCERQMVQRTSSKDGSKFWGCSGYPRCKYTMSLRPELQMAAA